MFTTCTGRVALASFGLVNYEMGGKVFILRKEHADTFAAMMGADVKSQLLKDTFDMPCVDFVWYDAERLSYDDTTKVMLSSEETSDVFFGYHLLTDSNLVTDSAVETAHQILLTSKQQ
jgi:hypothetical protein